MTARLVPGALVDDRGMLAGIGDASMQRLAQVNLVRQHLVDGRFGPRLAAPSPVSTLTPFRHLARSIQLAGDSERRAGPGEAVKDPADERSLALDHDQPAVLDFVAEGRPTAHPHALLARGRELVPDPLADDLALELGERE